MDPTIGGKHFVSGIVCQFDGALFISDRLNLLEVQIVTSDDHFGELNNASVLDCLNF